MATKELVELACIWTRELLTSSETKRSLVSSGLIGKWRSSANQGEQKACKCLEASTPPGKLSCGFSLVAQAELFPRSPSIPGSYLNSSTSHKLRASSRNREKFFRNENSWRFFFVFPSSFGRAKLRRLSWEEFFIPSSRKGFFLVPPHKRPRSQCSPSHLPEKVLIENLFRALLDIDFRIPFIVSASSLLEIENSPSELLFFCLSFRRD